MTKKTEMPRQGWAVVVTKINSEAIAAKAIREAGHNALNLTYRKLLRPSIPGQRGVKQGKAEIVTRPVLQGYIFVEWQGHEFGEHYAGVSRVLRYPSHDGYTGAPKLVPSSLITELRRRCEAGEFDKLPLSRRMGTKQAKPGDYVRPTEGPFAGFVGKLVAIDDDKMRAVVALQIFGRISPATFENGETLELVESAEDEAA